MSSCTPGPPPVVSLAHTPTWGDRAAVEPLGRAHTLHGLMTHSATLAHRGDAGFHDLVALAETVPGLTVTLGGPDEVLDLLAPLIGAPAGGNGRGEKI